MGQKYLYSGLSDVGRICAKNEDRRRADRELGMFIVADGGGVQMSGEVASRAVVDDDQVGMHDE